MVMKLGKSYSVSVFSPIRKEFHNLLANVSLLSVLNLSDSKTGITIDS